MKRIILLIDMSCASNTSGVDRYIQSLIKGMASVTRYRLIWISLRIDPNLIFHFEEHCKDVHKITIPLPEQISPILGKEYWAEQYYRAVTDIAGRYFDFTKVAIVHLHTLNLVDWAILLRAQYGCKVITHLHCIPWKAYYNSNIPLFIKLYQQYYINHDYTLASYMTNMGEERSYCDSDQLVCVTQCAREFVERTGADQVRNIAVIPNGMEEDNILLPVRKIVSKIDPIELLFVGILSKSKGVYTLLNVTRLLQQRGYTVTISLVGKYDDLTRLNIETNYSDLSVNLPGRIRYDELTDYYHRASIGCIASLQEQSSYVAIEMCRYGLPIVTTAVDGLDEMFEHECSALKVPVRFDPIDGLNTDEQGMADSIERIINSAELQKTLSKGAQRRFQTEFALSNMIDRTVKVYDSVLQNHTFIKSNDCN